MKCADCKWWDDAGLEADYRYCLNEKTYIKQFPLADMVDKSQIMVCGYHSVPITGKEFGCIHFESK